MARSVLLRPARAADTAGSVAERHPVDLPWANYVSNPQDVPLTLKGSAPHRSPQPPSAHDFTVRATKPIRRLRHEFTGHRVMSAAITGVPVSDTPGFGSRARNGRK
jgi:hypothetical protein